MLDCWMIPPVVTVVRRPTPNMVLHSVRKAGFEACTFIFISYLSKNSARNANNLLSEPRLPLDKTSNGKYIELVTCRKENNDVDETQKMSSLLRD